MNFKIKVAGKVVGYDSMLQAVKDSGVFSLTKEDDGTFCIFNLEYDDIYLTGRQLKALGEELILFSETT
jgi:hypothetical protein